MAPGGATARGPPGQGGERATEHGWPGGAVTPVLMPQWGTPANEDGRGGQDARAPRSWSGQGAAGGGQRQVAVLAEPAVHQETIHVGAPIAVEVQDQDRLV